jgi:hypothetical protein
MSASTEAAQCLLRCIHRPPVNQRGTIERACAVPARVCRTHGQRAVLATRRGAPNDTSLFPREPPEDDEPAERLVAELVYALLSASATGAPAAAVLPKFHGSMSPQAYTSVLVALGRKQAWESASQVAAWVRQQGLLLPAASYVRLAQRRAEEQHWDRALDPIAWMRDHGCPPSGDTVLTVARLVLDGSPHMRERERMRELVAWLRTSDAGRALWRSYVPDAPTMAAADATTGPAWRSQGIAFEAGADIMRAPLNELKTTLRDIISAAKASDSPRQKEAEKMVKEQQTEPQPPPQAPGPAPGGPASPPPRFISEIDKLLKKRN